MNPTRRLSLLPPYVFGKLNDLKLRMRHEGADIIDLGMGNPDSPTPKHIVDKLVEVVTGDPKSHRYTQARGIPALRKA
ncbi:MAG: aminotransferase, partial [Candidatus Latescibacteria bacterium]|nr:aminotransferase [Candidatus Latescibacterota bacterium]